MTAEYTDTTPGVHLAEWASEFFGTAVLLLVVVSAITFNLAPGSPLAAILPAKSLRLLVTGLEIAGWASLFAITPPGKRSGAHLNPVVTLAFWITRSIHRHDLLGFWVAQFLGAMVGTALGVALWSGRAATIHDGANMPGPGVPILTALLVEAAMTAALLLMILFLLAHRSLARVTPLAAWILAAVFVWQLAPVSGTSMNPARSIGPAIFGRQLGIVWIYFFGPALGAVAAGVAARLLEEHFRPLTAKLFHDADYASVFATSKLMDDLR